MIGVAEMALKLGKSEDTVRSWARDGIIPAAKIRTGWLFDAEQVLEHLRTMAAEQQRERCPSTDAATQKISGAVSRSVVERFARAPAPRSGRRPKNTKPTFAVVTGGKSS